MTNFNRRIFIVVTMAAFGASGCAPIQTKQDPTPIAAPAAPTPDQLVSLEDAVKEVQKAIIKAYGSKDKAGMIASKATVTLKLGAVLNEQKTKWTVGVKLPTGAGLDLSKEGGNSSNGSLENTLQIEFQNPVLADKDSVLGAFAGKNAPKLGLNEWILDQLGPAHVAAPAPGPRAPRI